MLTEINFDTSDCQVTEMIYCAGNSKCKRNVVMPNTRSLKHGGNWFQSNLTSRFRTSHHVKKTWLIDLHYILPVTCVRWRIWTDNYKSCFKRLVQGAVEKSGRCIKSNTNKSTIYMKKHFHIILYLIVRHVSMSIRHHKGHFLPWSSREFRCCTVDFEQTSISHVFTAQVVI
jgi:hypothetical protein